MYALNHDQPHYAVYLHIPFCRKRCPYCDFYLRTDGAKQLDAFCTKLPQEWRLRRQHPAFRDRAPFTLYFGGGTPSLLDPAIVAEWIAEWRCYGLTDTAEITLEANPEDRDKFTAFRAAGINRLSLGVQSFQVDELKQLGRAHTPRDAALAVDAARDAGFASVSCDLIYALPFGSEANWIDTLRQAVALEFDHISCYSLIVEPGSAYWQRFLREEFALPEETLTERQLQLSFELLGNANYSRYELSNFAKPGHASQHNLAYWTGIPYLACGPSAHGYDGVARYANRSDLQQWSAALPDAVCDSGWEPISDEQHRIETIAMSLRLSTGLDLSGCEFSVDPERVEKIVAQGWGVVNDRRLILTTAGLVRENAITQFLL